MAIHHTQAGIRRVRAGRVATSVDPEAGSGQVSERRKAIRRF
jgi:hypothetical protein